MSDRERDQRQERQERQERQDNLEKVTVNVRSETELYSSVLSCSSVFGFFN